MEQLQLNRSRERTFINWKLRNHFWQNLEQNSTAKEEAISFLKRLFIETYNRFISLFSMKQARHPFFEDSKRRALELQGQINSPNSWIR